ncbi:MFS transporter [Bacillus megaterium NBRC 15308 = ATCC 14581]|nr:MFS transporter [Priestia megaterium NBRC 15308 = ATCC 14581]
MRYLFQNIGNVVGPLIGIIIYDKIIGYTFLLSSIMFLIFLLASYTLLRAQDFKVVKVDPISAKDTFSVLKDLNLQFWLLSSLFIVMAYGAYEALMPAVIIDSKNTRPAFGILVSLNALVVVLFQFIHIKYLKNLSLSKSISIGFGLLSIGFLFFILNGKSL